MPSFGTLKADTLTHSTAGSLATNFVVRGSAKASLHFNQSSETAVKDSFNISSVADDATGEYIPSFTNSMGNAFYSVVATSDFISQDFNGVDLETGRYELASRNSSHAAADSDLNCNAVHGDLA
jgi:hypothetical protein